MDALILFPLMFVVMWLLFVRPQQKRVRAQQELLSRLQPGDEVVTSSGLIGTVTAVGDDELVVEVSPGVHVRVLRGAVNQRLSPDDYEDEDDTATTGDTGATGDDLDLTDDAEPVDGDADRP